MFRKKHAVIWVRYKIPDRLKETSFSSTGKPGGSERLKNAFAKSEKVTLLGAPLGDGLLTVVVSF